MIINYEDDKPVITGSEKGFAILNKLILNEIKEIRSKIRKSC